MQVSACDAVIPGMAETRKAALYREVNLATAALLAEYGSDDVAHFLCECDDAACTRRLELRRAEFEAARAAGGLVVSRDCARCAEVPG